MKSKRDCRRLAERAEIQELVARLKIYQAILNRKKLKFRFNVGASDSKLPPDARTAGVVE